METLRTSDAQTLDDLISSPEPSEEVSAIGLTRSGSGASDQLDGGVLYLMKGNSQNGGPTFVTVTFQVRTRLVCGAARALAAEAAGMIKADRAKPLEG